jgi:hypothetical protein
MRMCGFKGLNWSLFGRHGDDDAKKKQIEMMNHWCCGRSFECLNNRRTLLPKA